MLGKQKVIEVRARLEEERIRSDKGKQLKEREHAIKAKERPTREKFELEEIDRKQQIADNETAADSAPSANVRIQAERQKYYALCGVT